MLKPSKTLVSSGNSLQHLWSYSSSPVSPPPLSGGYSGEQQQRQRSIHTTNGQSTSSTKPRQSYQCLHAYPIRHTVSPRRRAHTASNPQETSETYWHHLPSHKQPTPYDILLHPTKGPYNKRRFTYLVKLYHPDLSTPASQMIQNPTSSTHPSALPPSIRLQRYHLLIQAHTLLSDPAKRAAYDRHGAGWANTPILSDLARENSARGWAAARDDLHQRYPPGQGPQHCATWEDWEAFWSREAARQAREDATIFEHDFTRNPNATSGSSAFNSYPRADSAEARAWWVAWIHHTQAQRNTRQSSTTTNNTRSTQTPIYTSNGLFVLLVAGFTLGGAIWELGRAGRSSTSFMAQLERASEESWRDLDRRRRESREAAADADGREGCVGRFLRERRCDGVFAGRILEREGVAVSSPAAAGTTDHTGEDDENDECDENGKGERDARGG